MRQNISSGSPFEPEIGFSRAVRIGNILAIAGTAPIAPDGTVAPEDVERARQFYCDVLSFSEIEKPDALRAWGGFWLALGDQQIHVGLEDKTNAPQTKAHIAYEVESLGLWRKRLADHDVQIVSSVPIPDHDRFEFHDPFGNRVELIQSHHTPHELDREAVYSGSPWEAIGDVHYEFFDGDHNAAIVLNQFLYWTERTAHPEGWFYKTYEQWRDEIQFSAYQIRRVVRGDERVQEPKHNLTDVGLETKIQMAPNGRNATFYKLDVPLFVAMLVEWIEERFGMAIDQIQRQTKQKPQKKKPRKQKSDQKSFSLFGVDLSAWTNGGRIERLPKQEVNDVGTAGNGGMLICPGNTPFLFGQIHSLMLFNILIYLFFMPIQFLIT